MAGEKILVVDDDPEIERALKDTLEAAGYRAEICDTGNGVLAALAAYKPDLLVLDVMLPGVDGYTLTERIASDKATAEMPIIVLSGLEPSRTMFEKLPQVSAFLTKPFEPRQLLEEVRRALLEQKNGQFPPK